MVRYPFLIYWFLDWWWGSVLIIVFGFFSYYIAWQLSGVRIPRLDPAATAPSCWLLARSLARSSLLLMRSAPMTSRLAASRVRRQASDPAP